ncbi:MAG: lytic transglycosylase domain-containing protein [Devosia sp.]|nr:MAG: lytic transglycosylase domain-containing protein [Devosia sp.]
MTDRSVTLAGTAALALVLAGCSMAGVKPLPGNRSAEVATTAIASFAPVAATPAGYVPKAAAVPQAPTGLLMGYTGSERGTLDGLIAHYSAQYSVPEHLVRRVIVRESNYNPAARNGPYWGLMQISHATARGMGYSGDANGLLDAETNLRFAVRYLAGAYMTAGGNDDRAVQFYARGYYYDAKRLGLLEKSGLR